MIAIVAGAVGNKRGEGGAAWTRLSWVNGLRRIGIDAWLVEHLDLRDVETSADVRYAEDVARFAGLSNRHAIVDARERRARSMSWNGFLELLGSCDLLINLSGHLPLVFDDMPRRRVFVDLDPGFTQTWHAQGLDGARLAAHDSFVTVGLLVGHRGSRVPTLGRDWITMVPPVVLDDWSPSAAPSDAPVTTVTSWRGPYGPVGWDGKTYGVKAHEWRKVAALPRDTAVPGRIAVRIEPADDRDRAGLTEGGWDLVDPHVVAATPEAFRTFVRQSRAEFSVASGVYVGMGTGWFSDRTTRYLASGRAAIVQDTGWTAVLPAGAGLVAWSDPQGAAEGVRAVARDPIGHGQAARALAEQYFDATVVLPRLLDQLGVR